MVTQSEQLSALLLADDPYAAIIGAAESGLMRELVPEFMDLGMDVPDTHEHKDVLKHTALVVAKTKPNERVRLCAFFHDIGKPATRRFLPDGITTFHNHEAVGGTQTKKIMRRLGYEEDLVQQVSKMVRMSGRSKDAWNWSDAAVRRFIKEAGDCIEDLLDFYRCDTTTRYARKRQLIQMKVNTLEKRILEIEEQERKKITPVVDGFRIMEFFGLEPGPEVGLALEQVKSAQRNNPDLSEQEALAIVEEFLSDDDD